MRRWGCDLVDGWMDGSINMQLEDGFFGCADQSIESPSTLLTRAALTTMAGFGTNRAFCQPLLFLKRAKWNGFGVG